MHATLFSPLGKPADRAKYFTFRNFFFFYYEQSYLSIYWTDFHDLFTKWKVFAWIFLIWSSFSDFFCVVSKTQTTCDICNFYTVRKGFGCRWQIWNYLFNISRDVAMATNFVLYRTRSLGAKVSQDPLDRFSQFLHHMVDIEFQMINTTRFFQYIDGRCHGNQFSDKNGAKLPTPLQLSLLYRLTNMRINSSTNCSKSCEKMVKIGLVVFELKWGRKWKLSSKSAKIGLYCRISQQLLNQSLLMFQHL